jgi:hypothetical protein
LLILCVLKDRALSKNKRNVLPIFNGPFQRLGATPTPNRNNKKPAGVTHPAKLFSQTTVTHHRGLRQAPGISYLAIFHRFRFCLQPDDGGQ